MFIGRIDVEAETPILWPLMQRADSFEKTWCWERMKVGGEGDDRGWDGWIASPTWWTWVWASSGSWWWTGKPSMLQSMGLQRVRHDWTELTVLFLISLECDWGICNFKSYFICFPQSYLFVYFTFYWGMGWIFLSILRTFYLWWKLVLYLWYKWQSILLVLVLFIEL